MSADPHEASGIVSPRKLRRELEDAFPIDSQFDAFCVDRFPTIFRLFSSAMDRTAKLNLLLASIPHDDLNQKLQLHLGEQGERPRLLPAPASAAIAQSPPRSLFVAFCLGGLAILGAAATLLSGGAARWHATAVSAVEPEPPLLQRLPSTSAPATAARLTSEPCNALVFAVPSGRYVGQTPCASEDFALPPDASGGLRRVCIRMPGYLPTLVTLEPWSRSIHIQLQRETRAAAQRDLGQEACNVPAPLID